MDQDIARLDPVPGEAFKLSTGLELRLVPFKTRQLLRLLRILTHGAGAALMSSQVDFSAPVEEFAGRLLAMAALAIPDAETETIQFIASMVEPADLVKPEPGKTLHRDIADANQARWDKINEELFNPDPEDALDIIERVIFQIAPEIQSLGKALQRMLKNVQRLGKPEEPEAAPSPQELSERTAPAAPPEPVSPPPVSPAPATPGVSLASSESPTTTSPPSTDGPTSESVTFRSPDSDSAAPPSVLAGQPASEPAGG